MPAHTVMTLRNPTKGRGLAESLLWKTLAAAKVRGNYHVTRVMNITLHGYGTHCESCEGTYLGENSFHNRLLGLYAELAPLRIRQNYGRINLPFRNRPISLEQPVFLLRTDHLKAVFFIKVDRPHRRCPRSD